MAAAATAPGHDAWANYQRGGQRDWDGGGGYSSGGGGGPRRERYGGGGGGGYGGYRDRDGLRDSRGNALVSVEWAGKQLTAIVRDFSCLHPMVEARTEEQSGHLRSRWGISVDKAFEEDAEVPIPKLFENFEEAAFPDHLIHAMRCRNWTAPSPIQMQTWATALQGNDIIGVSPTGSGKTVAYALPMIFHIGFQPELKPNDGPVGLVLVPTRELCEQVCKETRYFAEAHGLRCESVSGGTSHNEAKSWLGRVHIFIATPGRLKGMLRSEETNLDRTTFVVLDEADDLCDDGMAASDFGSQVQEIMAQVRPDRQMLLFSATWKEPVRNFAKELVNMARKHDHRLRNTVFLVSVGGMKLAACKDIDQVLWNKKSFEQLRAKSKDEALAVALRLEKVAADLNGGLWKALVFVNRTSDVAHVTGVVRGAGYAAEGFGSDLVQEKRSELLRSFKEDRDLAVLVCTDLLSRGHDFMNVKYVINFDMPTKLETYVHRIGRTGRMHQKGFAVSFLEDTDYRFAGPLVDLLSESMQHLPEDQRRQKIPGWLKAEMKNKKFWQEQYRREAATRREAQAEERSYQGRGVSRREEFMAQLQGTGIARCRDLEQPLPPPPRPSPAA